MLILSAAQNPQPDYVALAMVLVLVVIVAVMAIRKRFFTKTKDVVMCACNNKQMYTIKKMVHTIDPKAFTIIVESNEVVGEGFKEEIPDIEL